ncbi:hypothetical protein [Pseudobutyrivibrio ruminis]|uniref:hypothetical protein n=1 Tax=Pseudobutyrivibrio ruminis TaxID=46206 RepID=UPI00051B7CCC|nr:hypothetical protein [Pseudobutyrivibrio ruminis]
MNRKNVLGFAMAIAMVAMLAFSGFEVSAAGLTQAQFPELVHYGTITDEDAQILKSFFDLEYYKEQNPDVVEQYGDSYEALFNHFCTKGVFEGRTGSADFDPAAYASAYGDLKAQFGTDILSYYRHYATEGKAVGRNITTIAACAEAGITVIGLANDSIVITPDVYRVAVYLGTNDYGAVRQSIAIAEQRAAATGGSVVIVADDAAGGGSALDGLEKVGTITAGNGLHIGIYVGQNLQSYGAWQLDGDTLAAITLISSTDGYVAVKDGNDKLDLNYRIASIPVSAWSAENTSSTLEDTTADIYITTGAETKTDYDIQPNSRETNGVETTVTSEYISTPSPVVADENGTTSTEYTVGFGFVESSAESVTVNVAIEGDDGLTISDTYTFEAAE